MSNSTPPIRSGARSPGPAVPRWAEQGFGSRDRVGALLSGLCLVHCLLLPAAVVAVPGTAALGAGLLAAHELAHVVLAALLVPVALVALVEPRGCCHRGSTAAPTGLLLGGLTLVGLAWPAHVLLGPAAEVTSTVAGSLLLIAGHGMRLRRQTHR